MYSFVIEVVIISWLFPRIFVYVCGYTKPLLFFYKNSFGIKEPAKVDMPLNNETGTETDLLRFLRALWFYLEKKKKRILIITITRTSYSNQMISQAIGKNSIQQSG